MVDRLLWWCFLLQLQFHGCCFFSPFSSDVLICYFQRVFLWFVFCFSFFFLFFFLLQM
ncbi:hypothetical protein ACJIZ3_000035 [Penstemon smallii]|uniref:Uncharacterized protein n=1 Tax=Penstemon smallii TaxID=265156 RepID=A0ABD3RBY1_9LAMI